MWNQLLNNFILDTNKNPAMVVYVIDQNGAIKYTYHTPAGFQLDLYVGSLYPFAELMLSETHKDCDVSVAFKGENEFFEIHHGVYQMFPLSSGHLVTRH